MAAEGERMDHCLVGEPTCPARMGETIKIGRRGSLTAQPDRLRRAGPLRLSRAREEPAAGARPPARPARRAHRSTRAPAHFGPSTLAITTIDVGNPAVERHPGRGPRHGQHPLQRRPHRRERSRDWIEEEADRAAAEFGVGIAARFQVSGESFLTAPGPFTDLVARAVAAETGVTPELSTSGGTSDARFIKDHCPVVEFGLVGATMHQVDEHVEVAHIHQLKAIYAPHPRRLLRRLKGREPPCRPIRSTPASTP